MPIGPLKKLFTNSKRKSILLFGETEEENRALALYLEHMGWNSKTVGSQAEAIKLLKGKVPFNALVLGARIQGANGITFAKDLRAERGLPKLPIVIIADQTKAGDSSALRERLPHTAILPRPFTTTTISKALSRAMEIKARTSRQS
ncbi:MAG: hypothetical protein ACYTGH_03720 [Planctomycetota bacterium]|jgi:DNA-binding NtrC family response regulator